MTRTRTPRSRSTTPTRTTLTRPPPTVPPPRTDAPVSAVPEPVDTEPTTEPAGSTPRPTLPSLPTTVTDSIPPVTTVVGPDEPADGEEIAGAPSGERGTHADPVAVGEVADIGGGWRMQVLQVTLDGTSAVMEHNQFNDPPPPGSQFTLVRVALGYFGVEEPTSLFYPTLNVFGADEAELDGSCGTIPDDVVTFTEVFAGSVTVGNLCAVTTPEDGDVLQISARGALFSFDEDPVFLALSPALAESAEPSIEPLPGPQPGAERTPDRESPTPVGTPVDLGEGWTFTVDAAAADITDAVLGENTFNDPPPEGSRFVGVDVTYAYDGPEASATPFAVTVSSVGSANRAFQGYCGVAPNEIDTFTELLPGGSVSGTMCLVIPAEDLANGTWLIYAEAGFDQDPVFLAVG